jgi:hypothetical protein
MPYKEMIAVCSEIHTKHINTVCGQNVGLLNVKLVVHIVIIGLRRVNGGGVLGTDGRCSTYIISWGGGSL